MRLSFSLALWSIPNKGTITRSPRERRGLETQADRFTPDSRITRRTRIGVNDNGIHSALKLPPVTDHARILGASPGELEEWVDTIDPVTERLLYERLLQQMDTLTIALPETVGWSYGDV